MKFANYHTVKHIPAQLVTFIPIAANTLADSNADPTKVGLVAKMERLLLH